MSPSSKITLLASALLAGALGIGGLKWRNARLRAEADGWRQRNAALSDVREENRRLRAEAEAAAQTVPTAAAGSSVPVSPAPASVAAGHLVPLEAFRNLGRDTPRAAFETIIWAVVKGDDATMVDVLSLEGAARAKAEAILARLPASSRAQYATPEKLVGIFFSAGILVGTDSFLILGDDRTSPTRATLRVQTAKGSTEQFPMVLGMGGWQLVVPERALTVIDRILRHPGTGNETAK
ncbi:MAG: hypothetical protein NTV51_05475 [Verrucomicrobia bacterium]|nr:hypothetical protein [Verrucomicrobiota bacterium]